MPASGRRILDARRQHWVVGRRGRPRDQDSRKATLLPGPRYVAYTLSLRHIEETMQARGVRRSRHGAPLDAERAKRASSVANKWGQTLRFPLKHLRPDEEMSTA